MVSFKKSTLASSLFLSFVAALPSAQAQEDPNKLYYESGAAYVTGCAQGGFSAKQSKNGSKGGLRFTFLQPAAGSATGANAIFDRFKAEIKAEVRVNKLGDPILCGPNSDKSNPVCLDGLFVCASEMQFIQGGTSVCPLPDQVKIPLEVEGGVAMSMYSKYLAPQGFPKSYNKKTAPGLEMVSFDWDDEFPLANLPALIQRVDQSSRAALTNPNGGLLQAVLNFNPLRQRINILTELYKKARKQYPGLVSLPFLFNSNVLSGIFTAILQDGGFDHDEFSTTINLRAFKCERNNCPPVPVECTEFTGNIGPDGCGIFKVPGGNICNRNGGGGSDAGGGVVVIRPEPPKTGCASTGTDRTDCPNPNTDTPVVVVVPPIDTRAPANPSDVDKTHTNIPV